MNRRLLDPFQSVQLPEVIEEYLEHGTTTCVAFNRRGTLLAAGTQEGQVVLWDFETRGVARVLERHRGSVASLSWSRNGRYLASVAADKLLVLWDVAQGRPACEAALPCAGSSVSLSPRPPYHCLVSLVEGAPLMLDMQARQERRLPLIGEAELGGKASTKAEPGGGAVSPGAVALFHPSGSTLVVGQARGGALLLLDRDSLMFLDVIKLPNTARVLTLTFNRKGDLLLLNCHDRTLRLFEFSQPAQPAGGPAGAGSGGLSEAAVLQLLFNANVKAAKPGSLLFPGPTAAPSTRPVVTPLREFMHAVERCAWVGTAFSADCEHVVAGAVSKTNHHIYIWSRLYGKMERILEGPKERLAGLAWHPLRSCLASLGSPSGRILLWARSYAENWSAFAPDFKELDENVEYVEREDEFDWATPGAGGQHDQLVAREQQSLGVGSASVPTTTTTTTTGAAGLNGPGSASTGVNGSGGGGLEEAEVDVVTVEEEAVFSSDSEGEQEGGQEAYLHHLSVEVEEDLSGPEAMQLPGANGAEPDGLDVEDSAGGQGVRVPDGLDGLGMQRHGRVGLVGQECPGPGSHQARAGLAPTGGGEPRRPGQDRSGLAPGGWPGPGQQGMGQPPPLGSQAPAPRHWGAEMGGPHPAGWPGADAAVGRGGWVAGQALERARWEERLLQHGQGYAAGYTQLQPQGGAAPMDDDDSEY